MPIVPLIDLHFSCQTYEMALYQKKISNFDVTQIKHEFLN